MSKDGWLHKKLKKYSFKGKIVMAVNKPHAAEKLGITLYPQINLIKKVKS